LLPIIFGCTHKEIIGYYETNYYLLDETIKNADPILDNFKLVKMGINNEQLKKLENIISNKNLHLNSDLGTCEITGLFVLKNKYIYITCGNAQIFICDKNGIEKILLNELGNVKLFELINDIRK
jgi:hypothetical protein